MTTYYLSYIYLKTKQLCHICTIIKKQIMTEEFDFTGFIQGARVLYQFLTEEFSQLGGDAVKTLGEARFTRPPVTGDTTARLFGLVLFIPRNSDHFQIHSSAGKGTCTRRTFEHVAGIGVFWGILLLSQVVATNPSISHLASRGQSALAKD